MTSLLKDRHDAGKRLGNYLLQHQIQSPFILGLPRGGVVVAQEVSEILKCPMSVVISRKIGSPFQSELGIGAISEDELPIYNKIGRAYFDLNSDEIQQIVIEEKKELRRRKALYRHGKDLPDLSSFTVIVIDDGLATGATAVAAAHYLRDLNPRKLILAIPVAPTIKGQDVTNAYDEIISLYDLEDFSGVGLWYDDFTQTEDEEVVRILSGTRGSDFPAWN